MMVVAPVMVVMMVPPMMVVPPVVVVMVVMKAWAGVEALFNPAPAVPDRTTDQRHRFTKAAFGGSIGERSGRQSHSATAGKRSSQGHDSGEY
jgi:hypothetical protein